MNLPNDENSLILRYLDQRTNKFQRNKELELLLDELSGYLHPVELQIQQNLVKPALPPLLLIGNPRSGTSIFMQFLGITEQFAVPTNLLSRFYYAPFVGSKIQLLLTDRRFDFKGELTDVKVTTESESKLGKTMGLLAPNEFFHFWRQFLPNYDLEYLNDLRSNKIDIEGLRKGVAAIESVFQKPFAAKAIILQYNLDLLSKIFENFLMVYIMREPIFIMQSILLAREEFYGDRNIWWSVKPKEYENLKEMDVYHQIAGQVYYTEKSIEKGLKIITEKKQLIIKYEEFCNSIPKVYDQIVNKYSSLGITLNNQYKGPPTLKMRNKYYLHKKDLKQLETAYSDFVAGIVSLEK